MGSGNSSNKGQKQQPRQQHRNQRIQRKTSKDVKAQSGRKRRNDIHETTFNKRLRENLRAATDNDDIAALQKQLETFEKHNLEDGGDYTEARERLDFLVLRKEIKDACLRRNVTVLDDKIKKGNASRHKIKLKPYLDRAMVIRQELGTSTGFKHDIPGLSHSTISEIRSYNRPPPGVHEAMIATYLCLGYPEGRLTDWAEICGLMARTGDFYLLRELSLAEGKKVDKTAAEKAAAYLAEQPLEAVRQTSNGAAAFYVWASRQINGVKISKNVEPNKPLTNTGGRGPQYHQTTVMQSTPNDPKDMKNKAKQQQNQQPKAKLNTSRKVDTKAKTQPQSASNRPQLNDPKKHPVNSKSTGTTPRRGVATAK